MFKSINKILKEKNKELQNKDFVVFEKIKKEWNKKIEKNVTKNVLVYDYNEGNLTLKTRNAEWRTEISTRKEEIKKKF